MTQARAELRLDDHIPGLAVAGILHHDLELDLLPLEYLGRVDGLLDLELRLGTIVRDLLPASSVTVAAWSNGPILVG